MPACVGVMVAMFIMWSGASVIIKIVKGFIKVLLSPEYAPFESEKGSLAVENGFVEFHRKQNQQSS